MSKTLLITLAVLSLVASCDKTKLDPRNQGKDPNSLYNGENEEENEVVTPPEVYNITGKVVDNTGNGIKNVVVSDGLKCVKTLADGSFYLESVTYGVKFVWVSTPSGYIPPVEGGLPKYYKTLASVTPEEGIYDMGEYVLTPVDNPNRFTILVTADPQPRSSGAGYDKIGYHSLDNCQDLYRELKEVSSSIIGRQVYGICLGDIVHENMSLYKQYADGLATLDYPTYNIIGNHDNDTAAADDNDSAIPFESWFGPRNYSFNIGGIHFVVLDNLIMKDNGSGRLSGYDQGLTDEIWAWLQADMSFVPTNTTVMVCAHSPMFKLESGSERTNTAKHGGHTNSSEGGAYGYGDLFDKYDEVHAWAGHTHTSFNYIYPETHRHSKVQVHTVARSTGELWTNEYLSSGTPRGFTIVEVEGGDISWRFHPTTRQSSVWVGTTSVANAGDPVYRWRDWDYTGGVAVMKDGSGSLDESYQLHVYPRGAYGDDYVYANVFLWDKYWSKPVFTQEGGSPVEMVWINSTDDDAMIPDTEKIHDLGTTEFRTWYKAYSTKLSVDSGYTASSVGDITTMFRAPANASPGKGTVSVTDRFGNTYTRTVSW